MGIVGGQTPSLPKALVSITEAGCPRSCPEIRPGKASSPVRTQATKEVTTRLRPYLCCTWYVVSRLGRSRMLDLLFQAIIFCPFPISDFDLGRVRHQCGLPGEGTGCALHILGIPPLLPIKEITFRRIIFTNFRNDRFFLGSEVRSPDF